MLVTRPKERCKSETLPPSGSSFINVPTKEESGEWNQKSTDVRVTQECTSRKVDTIDTGQEEKKYSCDYDNLTPCEFTGVKIELMGKF